MSQFGGQQFLYGAKPFNTVNVSGIDPGQAAAGLGNVKQGEQERSLKASMQNQELAQQQAQFQEQQALAQQQMAHQQTMDQWTMDRANAEDARLKAREAAQAEGRQALLGKLMEMRAGNSKVVADLDERAAAAQEAMDKADSDQMASSWVYQMFQKATNPDAVLGHAMESIADDAAQREIAVNSLIGNLVTNLTTQIKGAALAPYDENALGTASKPLGESIMGVLAQVGAQGSPGQPGNPAAQVPPPSGVATQVQNQTDLYEKLADAAAASHGGVTGDQAQQLQAFYRSAVSMVADDDPTNDEPAKANMKNAYDKLKASGFSTDLLAVGLATLQDVGNNFKLVTGRAQFDAQAKHLLDENERYTKDLGAKAQDVFGRLSHVDTAWAHAIGDVSGILNPAASLANRKTQVQASVRKALTAMGTDPNFSVEQLTGILGDIPDWAQHDLIDAMVQGRQNFISELYSKPELLQRYKPILQDYLDGGDAVGGYYEASQGISGELDRSRDAMTTASRNRGAIDREAERVAGSSPTEQGLIQALLLDTLQSGDPLDPNLLDSLFQE